MRTVRLLVPGTLALSIALVASGVLHVSTVAGLPSTPLFTLVLVPVTRFVTFLLGALALSGALFDAALGPNPAARALASRCSLGYALSTALLAIVTLADVMAVQWWDAVDATMLRSFLTQIDEGHYLAAEALLGCIAAWVLFRAQQPLDAAYAAVTIGIAVALPAFTGHSAVAVSHWIASAVMVPHLLAMSVWVGGLLLLVVYPDRRSLLGFRSLANIAVPTLLLSGVASAVARINDWASLLHDPYALVLLTKVVSTAVVVWLGMATRRKVAAAISDAMPAEQLVSLTRRTLATEGALIIAVLGLAVVLARMPNP